MIPTGPSLSSSSSAGDLSRRERGILKANARRRAKIDRSSSGTPSSSTLEGRRRRWKARAKP